MSESDCYIGNTMTIVEKIDSLHHRCKIMIHGLTKPFWTFAEFDSEGQLDVFRKRVGFAYELVSEDVTRECGLMRIYKLSKRLLDADWDSMNIEEIPGDSEKIKALSHGRIVDCFMSKDRWTVLFYRPDPENYDMYRPLPIAEHIKHQEVFGRY